MSLLHPRLQIITRMIDIVLFVLFLIVGCYNQPSSKVEVEPFYSINSAEYSLTKHRETKLLDISMGDTVLAYNDSMWSADLNVEQVKNWAYKYLFIFNQSFEIMPDTVVYSEFMIAVNRKFSVYTFYLPNSIPTGMIHHFSVLVDISSCNYYILPIYDVIYIQSKLPGSNTFGGFGEMRGLEHFYLYSLLFGDNKLIVKLNTAEIISGFNFPIGLYNENYCFEYMPRRLKHQLLDVNSDGYLDMVFRGSLVKYCEGGADRDGKKLPASKIEVSPAYIYDPNSDRYTLSDTSFVKSLWVQ